MESEISSSASLDHEEALNQRRALLTQTYEELPAYGSPAFWRVLQTEELPLEVLVRCLRYRLPLDDGSGRERLLEIMFERTYALNERWAYTALRHLPILDGERTAMVGDLCADLYERLFRALLDCSRLFWEENFLHCLYFERKHVYQAFLFREGYWKNTQVKKGSRIPRTLLESFDQPLRVVNENYAAFDVVDEQAQLMLETIVDDEVLHLVLALPERLKAVILLKFWSGCTDKEAAQALRVSDRTIRHRMAEAFALLRKLLAEEKGAG